MLHLDLTYSTPERNLACDEALLDECESENTGPVLRFWEPTSHFIVLGHANRAASEVQLEAASSLGIPVLRRRSGGGTVLQGPGCLDYALIFKIPEAGPLRTISGTNSAIMERHRDAIASLTGRNVEVKGSSDLAVGELKFSGNAQRRTGRYILFHGVFLLDLDLSLIQQVLRFPSKQPEYRRGRSHLDFLTNLRVSSAALKQALIAAWEAQEVYEAAPEARMDQLIQDRYGQESWNFRL